MKKILISVIALFSIISSYAAEPTIISGVWRTGEKSNNEVTLYRIVYGKIEPLSTYKPDSDNRFGFAFTHQTEGFYVIGSGASAATVNKYTFYFKPGDRLNVTFNDSTYVLTGKNTPENIAIQKWHNFVSKLEYRSIYFDELQGRVNGVRSTYVDFFPILEDVAKKANTYTSTTLNKKFDNAFAEFRKYDMLLYAWNFVMTPRTAHPKVEDYPKFYYDNPIYDVTKTTGLYKYPFGVSVMSSGLFIAMKLNLPLPANVNATEKMFAYIQNDTLKGEIALKQVRQIRTYDEYLTFEQNYGKYILTQDQKNRIDPIVDALRKKEPLRTYDFSGTDINDLKVSLSDFKGKVVVVDVWATWCGPCKAEIPHLKTLEKEYHGKDVVFMSISVDDAKNKQKWVDFVKKEELTGVQLFGGNGMASDVAKLYDVKAIPRFMVFGKDGKIVTDQSPRPSDPALKKMINDLMAK